MIQIDDITYTVGDGEFLGYNVYRDGEKIATLGTDVTSYEDPSGKADSKYQITALYTRGESAMTSVGELSAIDAVTADDVSSGVTFYDLNGQKVSGPVNQGIYIVRQAKGKTFKLIKK